MGLGGLGPSLGTPGSGGHPGGVWSLGDSGRSRGPGGIWGGGNPGLRIVRMKAHRNLQKSKFLSTMLLTDLAIAGARRARAVQDGTLNRTILRGFASPCVRASLDDGNVVAAGMPAIEDGSIRSGTQTGTRLTVSSCCIHLVKIKAHRISQNRSCFP